MPDIQLSNMASVQGTYDSVSTTVSSLAITTQLVNGLTVLKTADKQVWTDGVLTYTITLANNADKVFTSPTLNDTLDPLKITLVDDTVQLNGVDIAYTYVAASGLLTVALPDAEVGSSSVITFQVQKV